MNVVHALDRYLPGRSIFVLVTLCSLLSAQTLVWERYYNNSGVNGHDWATSLAVDRANNLVVVGFSQQIKDSAIGDVVTSKYSPNGDLLWRKRYEYSLRCQDTACGLALDRNSNIYIVGYSTDKAKVTWDTTIRIKYPDTVVVDTAYRRGLTLLRYAPDGTLLWSRFLAEPDRHLLGRSIAVDSSGNVFVAGMRERSLDSFDILVAKYDSSGRPTWTLPINAIGSRPARRSQSIFLAADPLGSILVTGAEWASGFSDIMTAKISPTGELLWTRVYDGTAHRGDWPVAVRCDEHGNTYVCGSSDGLGTDQDFVVVKYGPEGNMLLEARYNYDEYSGMDEPTALAVDPNGNAYVTGYSESFDRGFDFCTVKFDANGDTVWSQRYTGPGDEEDCALDLALDRSGNCIVTGMSYDDVTDYDITTVKYGIRGNQVWVTRRDEMRDADLGLAIALDSLYGIYVAGKVRRAGQDDMIVLKYAANDVGVARIISPPETIGVGDTVTPKVLVRNYSPIHTAFQVRFEMGPYFFVQYVSGLGPLDSTYITFTPWIVDDTVIYPIRAFTVYPGDQEPSNDTAYGQVVALLPWVTEPWVPAGAGRGVKEGGSLAFDPDRNRIYCLKGNNTLEFYSFDLSSDTWLTEPEFPASGTKRVKKGGSLVWGGNNTLYATRSSSTTEFLAYDVADRTWSNRQPLPLRLKDGASTTYVPGSDQVFLLCPGLATQNFWCYDIGTDRWSKKADLPLEVSKRKPKKGSCITCDDGAHVYALKGGTWEFYRYNIATDSWIFLPDIPNHQKINGKYTKKKIGNGAALAFTQGRIHALKGNNSREFWLYNPQTLEWIEGDSLPAGPRKRKVSGGGVLVAAGNRIFVLKGNNTLEMYYHYAKTSQTRFRTHTQGSQNLPGPCKNMGLALSIAPNPVRQLAHISFILPRTGRVLLRLFDPTGRLV
ncbi:MAG: SBBP repeat-containing protein, partial [candidate division WOR-3 bacterium]